MSRPEYSGVYAIYHVDSGRIYIGSSKNIQKRWNGHKCHLRRNIHHCQHLQNAWNKYGESAFRFDVLESCLKDSLMLRCREQHWLDQYCGKLFNASPYAESTRSMIKTDEHIEKLKSVMKGNQHSKGVYRSKYLTERDVIEILHRFAAGELKFDIAASFNVKLCTIQRIVARKTWATIKVDLKVDEVCRKKCGMRAYKVKMGVAKLDFGKADEIRQRHTDGETQASLARSFGIHVSTIREIVKGRAWIRQPIVRVDLPLIPPLPLPPPKRSRQLPPKPPRPRKKRVRVTKPKPERIVLTCETCGTKFHRNPADILKRTYCSKACYDLARSKLMKLRWSDPEHRKRLIETLAPINRRSHAKLKEEDVRDIKARLRSGHPVKSIAISFGVAKNTINLIKQGNTWIDIK